MPTKFLNLDRDPQLTANSDYFIASQKAVKTALDTKADKESTYTKDEVNILIDDVLPEQTDNAGKFLQTNGEDVSWQYSSVINDMTNSTEIGLSQLVINRLTQEEYDRLQNEGLINHNELYVIDDGNSEYITDEVLQELLATKANVETTYTKDEVNDLIDNIEALPTQEGNSGKALVTDGENASWEYTSVINDITNASETGLSKLVINKLSQEEYDSMLEQNAIQDNELYIINDGNSQYVTEEELQQSLVTKADADNVYTKDDVNNIVSLKADQETTYTKTEVDELFTNFEGGDSLPEQLDNAGKALVTDGENARWEYTSKINDITNSTEIGLSQLVINKLTQDEYNTLLNNEEIRDDELYIINDGNSQYVTDDELVNALSSKADQETTYTKTEVDELLENVGGDNLPDQTDNSGKALVTDGTTVSWEYTSKINDITNDSETGLSQLVINKVTMAEYKELQSAGLINENELYMTEEVDTDYITQTELESALENIGSGSAGRNIGDIFYTSRLETELNGAVECNGAIYNINDYEGEQSIGNLLANGSLPYVSLSDYENAWKTNGSVRCFGYDEGGDTFRVPTLTDVYIKAGTAETFDEFNAESLPNITGTLGTFATSPSASTTADSVNKSGAFNQTVGTTLKQSLTTVTENAWARTVNAKFDASDSNDIYQNGAKVNPDNIRYRAMVQIYNGAKEIAIVDYTNQVEEAVAQGIQEIETAVSNGVDTTIPVIDLGTVAGEQLLEVNKAYKMILSGKEISFNMNNVEIVANVVNQIKIYLQVDADTTIDWGTTYFYNGTIPEITGGQYEIYYEYNHNLGTWVVGAMSVGVE